MLFERLEREARVLLLPLNNVQNIFPRISLGLPFKIIRLTLPGLLLLEKNPKSGTAIF